MPVFDRMRGGRSASALSSAPIRLTPLENLFAEVHDRFDGEGMGAMVVKVRGRIEEGPLRAALCALTRRHPRLRARVVESPNGQRHFHLTEPAPPIPLEIQDYDTVALPWKEETHRRFCEKTDLAVGPLARLLVLRSRGGPSCYVILLAHHAIFDGLSLLHTADDLFRYYEEAEQAGNGAPVAPLRFVSCSRARRTGTLRGRLGVFARTMRMRRDRRLKRWTRLPPKEDAPSNLHWAVDAFSVEQTMALMRRSGKEKASLDGALFAAAACALRAALSMEEVRFKLRVPVDVRALLDAPTGPVSPGDLGCFVTAFDEVYTIGPRTSFWPLARQAHADLRRFIAAGGPSLLYNLARFVRPRVPLDGFQRGTVHSSMIGVAPLEKRYGGLSVEECAQIYKNDRGGASINLVAIVLQLRLNLTVHAADLPEGLWRRFREEMMAQLCGAMKEGSS